MVRPPLAQAPGSQEKCVKEQVREREGGILNDDQARLGNRRRNRYGLGITQTVRDWEAELTVTVHAAKPGLSLGLE